jgi:hypothetical protein
MSRALPQLIVFSYHKSGTTLFLHVMTKVCERLGLTLVNHYGRVDRLELEPDVILLPHSVLRGPLDRPYRAIRLIRDPRDIWLSGYLYHLRCTEEWCINTDVDPTPPIQWPKVDHSVAHWPEEWKQRYLERLGGKSYQQNLRDRSLADGLDFELGGYTGCTFETMREWALNEVDALDVRLEEVMADFDGSMRRIFDHFNFTADQIEVALEAARSEDVRRMDDAALSERPQISSRTISKWRDILSPAQIARFEESHGELIRELGYESADANGNTGARRGGPATSPPRRERRSVGSRPLRERGNIPATTRDAGIRLVADGASIRPTVVGHGVYTFIVPAGSERILLESRHGIPIDPRARCLGDTRRLGVKVIDVTVRSAVGDSVIAADDPRLSTGWHDAEHAGNVLWRWTDGSAELPWTGVSGPAVVTVRCSVLPEYIIYGEALRG